MEKGPLQQGAPGVDGINIEKFPKWGRPQWNSIKKQLLDGTYAPSPALRVETPKESGGNFNESDPLFLRLTKFGISISLEFRFNDLGEITGIYTEDRFGRFDDKYVKHPWEGRFRNYQEFNGIKIPTKAEVGWHLPEGWWLFWKGNIVNTEFEYRS